MNLENVGCYVAFPEVRYAILLGTAVTVGLIYVVTRAIQTQIARNGLRAATERIATPATNRNVSARATTFTVVYCTETGEGDLVCRPCGIQRSGIFPHLSSAFAFAAEHLNLACSAVQPRVADGSAIIDGSLHPVVWRDGGVFLGVERHVAVSMSTSLQA